MVKRGEVWLCALDPTVGSEIQKTRPCVVVSPDELNDRLRTVIVAPMTTGSCLAPFRVAVTFQGKKRLVLPDQLSAIVCNRLIKKKGMLDDDTLKVLTNILLDMFA